VGSCEASLGAAGVGWTIKPGSPTGDELGVVGVEAGAELDAEFEVVSELDLDFCAQGGRSGLSWLKTVPPDSRAKTARIRAGRERWGVIRIGY
jgi:hypothetical protein